MVMAWADALSDVDFADALEAVTRHYRVSRAWMMPVDVVDHVETIAEEREAAERAARYASMRAITPTAEPVRTTDRSAELRALLRRSLPPGRPDKLRGPAWRAANPGLRDGPSTRDGA
jgi:hypothetical protein